MRLAVLLALLTVLVMPTVVAFLRDRVRWHRCRWRGYRMYEHFITGEVRKVWDDEDRPMNHDLRTFPWSNWRPYYRGWECGRGHQGYGLR